MVKRGRQGLAVEKARSKEAQEETILDELEANKKKGNETEEEVKAPINVKHIIGIAAVLLIVFAIFMFVVSLKAEEHNRTIDEYHALSYEGKESDINFLYNGYSFVKARGMWHTELIDRTGKKAYQLRFRYSPKEVLNVTVAGPGLYPEVINASQVFMSFNPEAEQMNYVALAAAEMTLPLAAVVKYDITAACQKNLTDGCESQPIVTCEDNPDSLVLEIHEGGDTGVIFDGNCIIVDGVGEELMRASDRLLYEWLGVIRN